MASNDSGPRVGRSLGASIFWGLVSVFFAAAACFYFLKSHENEVTANKLRDEVLSLQDERDTLSAEKQKLQASMTDTETQLKAREDFLAEKEAKLAAAESKLENGGYKPAPAPPPPPPQSTATVPKKFSDALRKLSTNTASADLGTRGGRPLLRLPNATFFDPGEATLTTEGKAALNQLDLALTGVADSFELRIECYTTSDLENPDDKPKKKSDDTPKPHYKTSWDLTSARATALQRYYRDQTSIPIQNVLIIARGDSQPIATGKGSSAQNRRVEISLAPIPAAFQPDPTAKDTPAKADKDKSSTDKPAKASDKTDKSADSSGGNKNKP